MAERSHPGPETLADALREIREDLAEAFREVGDDLRAGKFEAGGEELPRRLIQLALDRAADFLALETPKELVQQLGVSAEMIRRARGKGASGVTGEELVDRVRSMFRGEGLDDAPGGEDDDG